MTPPVKKKTKDSSKQGSRHTNDRISALPDSLLHQILSFLTMKDVVATSLLSSRWRYLWTSTPTLDFGTWGPQEIGMALILYEGTTIRRFRVCSYHIGNDEDVDDNPHVYSWVRFAVRHQVQELDIDLSGDDYVEGHEEYLRWMLHPCLFTCGSIAMLRLRLCDLNLPTSVNLPLLKTLELWYVILSDDEFKVLTSGCPLLENMTLVDCNNEGKLNIFAPNIHLKSLRIHDYEPKPYSHERTGVEIFAPYLLSLEFGGAFRSYYKIQNLSSIVSVNLDFAQTLERVNHGEFYLLPELLSDLSCAKTLKLSGWCLQVLAVPEVLGKGYLDLSATSLELKTGLTRGDHIGMTYLLRSLHHLKCLTINISEIITCTPRLSDFTDELYGVEQDLDDWPIEVRELEEWCEFDGREYWKLLELSLSPRFSHIKTINIYGFMGSESFFLTKEEGFVVDKYLERRKNEVELIRFLLKNSKALDKMIITTTKSAIFSDCTVKSELLFNLTKQLLVLPRASQNAEIIFSENINNGSI